MSSSPLAHLGLLLLAVLGQDGVHFLEGLLDALLVLRSCQYDLSANENEEDDFWRNHAIDEPWEDLGFVCAVLEMAAAEPFEGDGELHVARANDVLNLEVLEAHLEADALDPLGIDARSLLALLHRFGPSAHHLTR